ncbi:PIN domain-containing protein [Conexibacter stalactiti]|uniref:PIN domain-containing protein n=1 Tax=Conexibacter stalactiti TaxID=1940611 RepID=A0ABU4HHW7_9ACTN|nr:PIN domain-containing protein [Conexibacter stalactiti]MDW5592898.1 PIN domain-containing protein [Conexibacter stalactiti]MEC5033539.1 PIN domain-containing protein [Conexibacter stalactiti]
MVDANVVLKWLRPDELPSSREADLLYVAHKAGRVRVTAPTMLPLEVLNVTARKWRVAPAVVAETAHWFDVLGLQLAAPDLPAVARWVKTGLSAYDAAYVAVAEAIGAELITADRQIVAAAPGHARSLADVAAVPGLGG